MENIITTISLVNIKIMIIQTIIFELHNAFIQHFFLSQRTLCHW